MADQQTAIAEIRFPSPSQWQVSIRLDGEAIFLNLPNDWPNMSEFKSLEELYTNETLTGDEIRIPILESLAKHIRFLVDDKPISYESRFSKDPEFDYEPSFGESLWGLIEYEGLLPQRAKSFRLHFPREYYPLVINLYPANSKALLTDIFPAGLTRPPEPYFFESSGNIGVNKDEKGLVTYLKGWLIIPFSCSILLVVFVFGWLIRKKWPFF